MVYCFSVTVWGPVNYTYDTDITKHTGNVVTAGRDDIYLVHKPSLCDGCPHGYRIDRRGMDALNILIHGIQQFLHR